MQNLHTHDSTAKVLIKRGCIDLLELHDSSLTSADDSTETERVMFSIVSRTCSIAVHNKATRLISNNTSMFYHFDI